MLMSIGLIQAKHSEHLQLLVLFWWVIWCSSLITHHTIICYCCHLEHQPPLQIYTTIVWLSRADEGTTKRLWSVVYITKCSFSIVGDDMLDFAEKIVRLTFFTRLIASIIFPLNMINLSVKFWKQCNYENNNLIMNNWCAMLCIYSKEDFLFFFYLFW